MDGRREVGWDGAVNLRDLGGVPRSGGGYTRFGRVYRSARPEFLTERGWRQARDAGLAVLVDLRNADEVGRSDGDPVVADPASAGVQRVHCPVEDHADEEFRRVCGPWLDHPRSYADHLALFPRRFARLFRTLAGLEAPALVHCAGGRDRTGLVSAMLLSLAGVAVEAIVADYELAARGVNAYLETRPDGPGGPARTPAELERWLAERGEALAAWIGDFDAAGYLSAVGLSAVEVRRLAGLLG